MSKGSPPAKSKPAVEVPDLDSFIAFSDELGGESERGAVLVAATRIDELLRSAITARIVDHPATGRLVDGFNAPLGSFSARILAAFALGIISECEHDECNRIRKIRNEFAHKLGITFGDQRIVDLVMNLEMGVRAVGNPPDLRRRFTSSAVTLAGVLNRRADWVSRDRLEFRVWGFTDLTG